MNNAFCLVRSVWSTVMTLCFGTDRFGETVQTVIRLLLEEQDLEEQSDQGLHCGLHWMLFQLHYLEVSYQGMTSYFEF